MAYYHQSYSDIITEHLHMQIHENMATNTRILRAKANDGKEFAVGVDNASLALSQDPQGVMYNAASQLQNAISQHNSQLAAAQQAYNQSNYANQQAANYLNQLAQAHPIIAKPAQVIEEVEEEVEKVVHKAKFDWRRFIERVMHWPIDFIDWSIKWA